ncbi:MAG: sigma-70 family RNA polymerase sigma factor [Candidatus Saccharimonadales bacterium]
MNPEIIVEGIAPAERCNQVALQAARLAIESDIAMEASPVDLLEPQVSDTEITQSRVNRIKGRQKTPEVELFELSYLERAAQVESFVTQYRTHRQVRRALIDYKLSGPVTTYSADPYTQYFNEIGSYPLLTKDDETTLFGMIDRGVRIGRATMGSDPSKEEEQTLIDAAIAYNKVFYSNLRLVINATQVKFRKQSTSSVDQLDYIQECNFGLDDAIKRFNVSKGFKFSTYAMNWLRQKSQREYASKSRPFSVPINVQAELNEILNTQDYLYEEFTRMPTIIEIAKEMKKEPSYVEKVITSCARDVYSLHDPLFSGSEQELGDIIPSSSGMEPFLDQFADIDLVDTAIKNADLSHNELLVISLRYHLYFEELVHERVTLGTKRLSYADVFVILEPDQTTSFIALSQMLKVSERALKSVEKSALSKIKLLINE